MANATSKEQMEFVYAMAKHSKATMYDLQRLLRLGSTHHGLKLAQCNEAFDTHMAKRFEAKESRVQASIIAIVKGFGASAVFSGDPRGCTVKIVVPDGYTNDWGSEGICVPTA